MGTGPEFRPDELFKRKAHGTTLPLSALDGSNRIDLVRTGGNVRERPRVARPRCCTALAWLVNRPVVKMGWAVWAEGVGVWAWGPGRSSDRMNC